MRDYNPPHGTLQRYQSKQYMCRCRACKTANTESWKAQRAERMARLAVDPTLVKHGTYNGYHNWGCRCDPCLNAANNKRREREGRKPLPADIVRTPANTNSVKRLKPLRAIAKNVITPAPKTEMPDLFDAKKDRGRARTRPSRAKPFGRDWLQDAV